MKIKGEIKNNKAIINDKDAISWLSAKGYGEKKKHFFLDEYETNYLIEKGILKTDKDIKCLKEEYAVYKYFREKGFIVKTALKFGADFRLYKKKGEHTRYIVSVEKEGKKLKNRDIVLKNRLAESIKAKLILAIVGKDLEVLAYEIKRL